jgi:[ribosomal protein S5]-alanine N-acetyltransferase
MSAAAAPVTAMKLCPIEADGLIELGGGAAHPAMPAVVEATVALYRRRGFVRPWIGFVAVEAGQAVGTCGFAAPPGRHEAEVAYFTFPGHEGRGVATHMARRLIATTEAEAAAQGLTYVAHTLPEEGPSASILRKLGFVLEGSILHAEDGTVWKWQRAAEAGSRATGRQ